MCIQDKIRGFYAELDKIKRERPHDQETIDDEYERKDKWDFPPNAPIKIAGLAEVKRTL